MAISKVGFASMAEFAEWAETNLSEYVAATDYSSNVFTAYRDEEKTEPLFSFTSANAPSVAAYKSASVSRSLNGKSLASAAYPKYAWSCKNGILIDATDRNICILLTKANTGETLTVIGADSSSMATGMTNTYVTAYGDDTTLTAKKIFTARSANQVCLVPFCSDAALNAPSFSPKAFYMPESPYYSLGMGRFQAGGKIYLTNGYWAILDE